MNQRLKMKMKLPKYLPDQQGMIPLIVLLVVVILVVGGIFIFKDKLGNPLSPGKQPQQTITKAPDAESTATVEITKTGFMPATIKVKKNTSVEFVNKDSVAHWVASDPHPTHTLLPGFDSMQDLNTEDTYSFTFDQTGTFTYHDHLNPTKFKGSVIVE